MSHYYINDKNLKSNPKFIKYKYLTKEFNFKTDNGVFSKEYVDFGTNLLLKSIEINDIEGPILDLCCGYGVVGIVLATITNKKIYATDINIRAVNLAKDNALLNNVNIDFYTGDKLESIPLDIKFSQILLNPPIRAGKEVIFNLYKDSYDRLNKGGELDIVIQKKQGKDSTFKYLETIYSKVEVINKDKGYFIIKAIK